MQLRPNQLDEALKKELKPAYLICGDEPWQLTLLADKVRQAAGARGFSERLFYVVLPGFNWQEIALEEQSYGLFAAKRLLDVIVPNGKIDRAGSRVLEQFAHQPPEDTLLLLTIEASPPTASGWFKALAQIGVVVRVERVVGDAFLNWLRRRAQNLGLKLSEEAAERLAAMLDGNLVVADQLLQQLKLLYGEEALSVDMVQEVVEEDSRLTLFDWLETLLRGDPTRALHHLHVLRQEGTPPALVLWGIVQEIRKLLQLLEGKAPLSKAQLTQLRIWPKQRPLYRAALKRFSKERLETLLKKALEIDRQIKGLAAGTPWPALEQITLALTREEAYGRDQGLHRAARPAGA